jgi:hypothetical protein
MISEQTLKLPISTATHILIPPFSRPTSKPQRYLSGPVISAFLPGSHADKLWVNSLRGTHENIGSMSAQLDWRGMTPFGELSGVFPFTSSEDFDNRIANFSAGRLERVSLID